MKKKKNILIASSILLLLLLTIPTHIKVSSSFEVKPFATSEIRAEGEGFITKVHVKEGSMVRKGDVIATLKNPDLNQDIVRVQSKLELENRQLSLLQASYDATEYQMRSQILEQLQKEEVVLHEKISKLELRSPIEGRVATPGLQDKQGRYVKKGELFCRVLRDDQVKLELPVQEFEIEDIQVGNEVKVKLDAYPEKTIRGTVAEIAPAGADYVESVQGSYARFRVIVNIPNPENRWISGMKGDAKIYGKRMPILIRAGREVMRWIRSRVW